jgi:DNA invertase Pin-like site-specific DNA recombinase
MARLQRDERPTAEKSIGAMATAARAIMRDTIAMSGAALRTSILAAKRSTRSTGKLILTIFAGFAQFEREMMPERQREGIAKAQAEADTRAARSWPRYGPPKLARWSLTARR